VIDVPSLTLRPIGVIRTPFQDRLSAPRQPAARRGTPGTIELYPGQDFEHALSDLEHWDHVWVLFWFHLNTGWRPKVLPPRSTVRRGVFATRSPHRPNPIGMSVLRLDRVDASARILHVRDVDIVDGTPVLDIKPYVPYADSVPNASTGWLDPLEQTASDALEHTTAREPSPGVEPEALRTPGADESRIRRVPRDPRAAYEIVWHPLAAEQAAWIAREEGSALREAVDAVLALGTEPHPYRRIKREQDGFCLAFKAWRLRFAVEGTRVNVRSIASGYRPRDLATSQDPAVVVHRAFVARFEP
jgi:tRNA-Thr(GGU) m(6)t(6)A37 methyltransferase TsaA